jgi:hypothetical protein
MKQFFTYLFSLFKVFLKSLAASLKDAVTKYFLFILKTLTILGVCYFVYGLYKDKNDTERKYKDIVGKEEQFKRINDYVADLEKKYLTEKQMREELEKRWGEQKKNLEGRIKYLSDTVFSLKNDEQEDNLGNSKLIEVSSQKDGKKGPPLCYVKLDKDNKIYKKVYDFEINVDTAMSRDEDSGKYFILTKANLTLLDTPLVDSEWKGKPYPLKISNGVAIIDPTEKNLENKFYWFDPKLNGGINFGVSGSSFTSRPSLAISWMGYGLTKNDLKWKFINTGIDFNTKFNNPGINFSPFLYRPFDSFIVNTYVGPGVSYSSSGVGYYLGLSLGF